jgi:hypothetical protein
MRPSQPVRHFCAFLNHGFFCCCLRFSLLVERLGTATRFTPGSLALASLAAEKNPASAAARSGTRPNNSLCFSIDGVSKSESLGRWSNTALWITI